MQPEIKPAEKQLAQCHHCGRRDVGSHAAGWASVNSFKVCHPNDGDRPDCYSLVTLHHHEMPCLECGQPELWEETSE